MRAIEPVKLALFTAAGAAVSHMFTSEFAHEEHGRTIHDRGIAAMGMSLATGATGVGLALRLHHPALANLGGFFAATGAVGMLHLLRGSDKVVADPPDTPGPPIPGFPFPLPSA